MTWPSAGPPASLVALADGHTILHHPDDHTGDMAVNDGTTVGTGDLTGSHNTPLHVGTFVIVAVVLVIALQILGFRFVVSAGIGS